jgi:hypothetical protein
MEHVYLTTLHERFGGVLSAGRHSFVSVVELVAELARLDPPYLSGLLAAYRERARRFGRAA